MANKRVLQPVLCPDDGADLFAGVVMTERGHSAPWTPPTPVEVTPADYERQVVEWLRSTCDGFRTLRVEHQAKLIGASGSYAFDAIAEFEAFGGAKLLVLIECKRHADRVKRDDVLALEAKLRDVGAHKAMLFSTAGFQRGAIQYASKRGIATITFMDGKHTYHTRSASGTSDPPAWANLPVFAGWLVTCTCGVEVARLISDSDVEALRMWVIQRPDTAE